MPDIERNADHEHEQQPVELPIDGTLDLHTFLPRELKSLLPEYIDACRERGILDLRIVHGKGKGVLRRSVEALLARHPAVASFGPDPGSGSWGATRVRLHPAGGSEADVRE